MYKDRPSKDQPTRRTPETATLLFHIYSSHPSGIVKPIVLQLNISDHDLSLCMTLCCSQEARTLFVLKRNFRSFDATQCEKDLRNSITTVLKEQDTEKTSLAFKEYYTEFLDRHAPPWFD